MVAPAAMWINGYLSRYPRPISPEANTHTGVNTMAASIREAFVGWLFSLASSANKKANLAKAATLKVYDCRLSWTDPKVITNSGKPALVEIGTTVVALSEQRAREISQERATKEDPLIESPFTPN